MRHLVRLVSGLWLGVLLSELPAVSSASAAEPLRIPDCVISPEDEVLVPAQEAGSLKELPVREGQQVKKGDQLAQIDDLIPQAQVQVARAKLNAAIEQANSTVAVDYATAGHKTAQAELRVSEVANQKVPGSVTDVRLEELGLKCTEMLLSIEKAKTDRRVAISQAHVAQAELKAAEANRDHRRITSELDGEVVELSRHVGEWVQAGETLMRVVRLDRLRVDGSANIKNYLPAELQNRPVTISVELARGKKEEFTGKVVFVKPIVDTGGVYQVRAEVQNRKVNGAWVLPPGLVAEMNIQLQ